MSFTGKAASMLERLIAEAEVLHLHGLFAAGNWWMARRAARLGTPWVVSLHGQLSPWSMKSKSLKKRWFLSAFGRAILRDAAFVHAASAGELDAASERLPGGTRTAVAAPMVDLDGQAPGPEQRGEPVSSGDVPTLLFLGRLHPTKSPDVAIEAVGHLRDAGVACRLIVAGSGNGPYYDSLRALARARRLHDSVVFRGAVDAQAKRALYRQADLFLLPSRHENFGLVLIEALSSGLPVITTRGVDIWKELEGGGGALIVDRTGAAIGEAAAGVLADPERRRAMGERGRAWARETYATSRCLARFEAMYAEAAGARPPER